MHDNMTKYIVFAGTSKGGTDVLNYIDVGIANNFLINSLKLTQGKTYYASVRGIIWEMLTIIS